MNFLTMSPSIQSTLFQFSKSSKSIFYFILFVGLSSFSLSSNAAGSEKLRPQELVKKLQQGGYVLYVRHAATEHRQQDKDLSDLSRCDLQRNLSQQGKDESRMLKRAINQLNIKIGEVYTSPYCRCVDTAKIAFGHATQVNELRAVSTVNLKESKKFAVYLKNKLSSKPIKGFNTVLVSHTANLRELTKIWPKPEGVVHVFEPLGNDYKHLGKITPTEWSSLSGLK